MHRVSGIGGFFFRATNPEALDRWYRDNLGIDPVPQAAGEQSWRQEAGETAFTSMSGAVDQFNAPDHAWAINFRVRDLDGMVEQLRGAGVEVEVDPSVTSFGRFATLTDPEGNPIQLWEPTQAGPADESR